MRKRRSTAVDPESFVQELSPRIRVVVEALRAFVKKRAPQLDEQVKWGSLCSVGNEVVCFIHPFDAHVDFGFFQGISLDDPKGVLGGKGKFLRKVKVREVGDFRERELARLLKQAVVLDR